MGIEVEHSFSASVVRHGQSVAKVVVQSRVSVFEIVRCWPILDASDRYISEAIHDLGSHLELED
jgi:hypothetical protein